jgi:uncharacterized protein YdeI (YjbR/CyaY-like superfamily)
LANNQQNGTEPTFFATAEAFRAWLEAHHAGEQELLVGYYKKGSGKPSITWPESVDQALCFGWIDGVRRGRDDTSYTIRFTPRKRRSIWSAVNIRRFKELAELGLVHPAGHKAFAARADERSAVYAYEQRDNAVLDAAAEQQFRQNARAWEFFQDQPAGYRKTAIWWVISAKKEETRNKRLVTLIDDSAQGRTIAPLTRKPKPE